MESSKVTIVDPPEILLFSGEWEPYEEALFQVFQKTLVTGGLAFLRLPVKAKWFPDYKGKHFTFWHLISEGEKEDERTPDIRRCERLEWISWILKNCEIHPDISYWENRRNGSKNYVIWYEKGGYAVILSRRSGYFLLKTAYYVTEPHRIKAFQSERDKYNKQGNKC